MGLYLKARDDEEELAIDENTKKASDSVVHEVVNKRWEVCVTTSVKGFQQASFVNSIATTKVRAFQIVLHVFLEWYLLLLNNFFSPPNFENLVAKHTL